MVFKVLCLSAALFIVSLASAAGQAPPGELESEAEPRASGRVRRACLSASPGGPCWPASWSPPFVTFHSEGHPARVIRDARLQAVDARPGMTTLATPSTAEAVRVRRCVGEQCRPLRHPWEPPPIAHTSDDVFTWRQSNSILP